MRTELDDKILLIDTQCEGRTSSTHIVLTRYDRRLPITERVGQGDWRQELRRFLKRGYVKDHFDGVVA